MRLKLTFLPILTIALTMCCAKNAVLELIYPATEVALRIVATSPSGEYAVVSIQEDTPPKRDLKYDLLIRRPIRAQVFMDLKRNSWWQLFDYPLADTIQLYEADDFSWSEDGKTVLFSVAFTYPRDTFELFPIYLCDLEHRTCSNLNKPWLGSSYYSIPLFSSRKSEIIFWAPTAIVDTVDTVPLTFISIGRIFVWDTLQRTIVEIKKGTDIADVEWMKLYDTTGLFMETDDALKRYSFATNKLETVLAGIRIESNISELGSKLVFIGRAKNFERAVYVFDLATRNLDYVLKNLREDVFRIDMNRNYRFVAETRPTDTQYVFIYSKEGMELASFKGFSPFWLAGTDTLIYSEGKRIMRGWLDKNNQLHKQVILRLVKK